MMVLHTKQDKGQIPFISACGSRRQYHPRRASKILSHVHSCFAASTALEYEASIDSSVGGNPVQFIPFIKTMRSTKTKRKGSVFGIAVFAHKAENVSRSAGRGFLWPWLSRTALFCRSNICPGLSMVQCGNRNRRGLMRSDQGAGIVKWVCDVFWAGRSNKALDEDTDKKFQMLQMGKF